MWSHEKNEVARKLVNLLESLHYQTRRRPKRSRLKSGWKFL
jgi:hypothetical protein